MFLRKNKNLSILLTIKGHHLLTCWHVPQFLHTGACSSPHGERLTPSDLNISNLGQGEQSTPQQMFYARRQGRTLQLPLTNLPSLPPSSASVQGQWLLSWPEVDQAAQDHYLLQPLLIVFCHHLDAMGRVGNF